MCKGHSVWYDTPPCLMKFRGGMVSPWDDYDLDDLCLSLPDKMRFGRVRKSICSQNVFIEWASVRCVVSLLGNKKKPNLGNHWLLVCLRIDKNQKRNSNHKFAFSSADSQKTCPPKWNPTKKGKEKKRKIKKNPNDSIGTTWVSEPEWTSSPAPTNTP